MLVIINLILLALVVVVRFARLLENPKDRATQSAFLGWLCAFVIMLSKN